MVFGALRSVIRPVSRLISKTPPTKTIFSSTVVTPSELSRQLGSLRLFSSSLTDTRFPKRRPVDKSRRKRVSLKPSGPFAWVKCEPGEPILPNQPNQGSFKRRNEKKMIKLQRSFISSEKRKRKAELQEVKRKKIMKRVERKMAAVARERAWAERLVELKQIEEEKKKKLAMA